MRKEKIGRSPDLGEGQASALRDVEQGVLAVGQVQHPKHRHLLLRRIFVSARGGLSVDGNVVELAPDAAHYIQSITSEGLKLGDGLFR